MLGLGKIATTVIGGFFSLLLTYAGIAVVTYIGGGAPAVDRLNALATGLASSVIPAVIGLAQALFRAAMGAIQ